MELARTINRVFYIPIRFCSILTVMWHVGLPLLLSIFLLFCPLEFTPASPDPRIPRRFGTSPRQSSMLSLRLALHQAFIGVLVFPSSPSQKLVYGLKSLPPNPHHFQRTHRYLARYDGPPVYLLLYHTLVFFMEQCLYL